MRYEIRGRVIDEFGNGIGGVRVEAWDKDLGLDDHLGSASTISDGSFTIVFDEGAFADLFFDKRPDLYFKVFCYNQLLVSTEDSVRWNVTPIAMPAFMNHHAFYPWTYLLPDGRFFIGGPHDPTHRFDLTAPAAAEVLPTINGNRSTTGEKGSSVLLLLRPPDYKPIVYIIGGNTPTTEQTAEMIDLSAPTPAWVALPDLAFARSQQFTATLLPDGRVFIAGGIMGGPDGGPCEIFDPTNPGAGWVTGRLTP